MSYIEITEEWVAENLSNGKLPRSTSIGSYTLIYTTKRGDDLCADCALKSLQTETDEDDPAAYVGTYDEGRALYCAGCNVVIESSYGDPDAEVGEE